SPVKGAFVHPFPGGANVMGLLKGTGDGLIVVQSHCDSEGGGESASDNAGGIATLLEMASVMKGGGKLKRSVLFVSFDGEEYGFAGAQSFMNNPPFPLKSIDTFLSIDSVGRSFGDSPSWRFFCAGSEFCNGQRMVLATRPWYVQLVGADLFGNRGSYALFRDQKIPFLFFTNGRNRDTHGSGDTQDKLNYKMMYEQVDFLSKLVSTLAIAPMRFKVAYAKDPKESPLLKAMWTEFKPKISLLPAPYPFGIPTIESRLAVKHPERSDLVQAFGLMETAVTPWVTTEALAVGEARRCEATGDKAGAVRSYQKALKASRTKMVREWYIRHIKEISP
ncbi:MAG TPA: M28 family peptidase, partial [Chroococcales cyanobacterium]